jgi:plasmid stabilization system protein ParE
MVMLVEEIAEHLTEFSLPAVHRFLEALERAQRQCSDFPDMGAPGTRSGTRRLVVRHYVVSCRRRRANVETFAIRHSSRRDPRL